jgi:polar amino acid transport system permease protein
MIAFIAVVVGFIIGVVLAGIKIAPKNNIIAKLLDKFADLYITVIRGTPMLVQLILMYGVILVSFKYGENNLIVPVLSFGINSGAYMAEIIRSGVNSVDGGQMEAGRSLGLNWLSSMRYIVIPQAIKVVVPTIFNEIIILVKETSVVSAIVLKVGGQQVYDLFGIIAKIQRVEPVCYTATILIIALVYLVIVLLLTLIQKMIEKRLSVNERR